MSLLALTACVDPSERCRASATRELATLNALIEEGENALVRGYREAQIHSSLSTVETCGSLYRSGETCLSQTDLVGTRPVTIDREAEQERLAELRARVPGARDRTKVDLARCGQ